MDRKVLTLLNWQGYIFYRLDTYVPTYTLAALETIQAVAVILAVVYGVEHLTLASDHWTLPRIDLN